MRLAQAPRRCAARSGCRRRWCRRRRSWIRRAVPPHWLRRNRCGLHSGGRPARAPTFSISPLMSSTVTRVCGPLRIEDAEGHVAGAAGHVEMAERPVAGRAQGRDERVLPEAVEPGGHEVVHQVVAARHRAEDLVDLALLLAEGHGLEPEMGVLVGHDRPAPSPEHRTQWFALRDRSDAPPFEGDP